MNILKYLVAIFGVLIFMLSIYLWISINDNINKSIKILDDKIISHNELIENSDIQLTLKEQSKNSKNIRMSIEEFEKISKDLKQINLQIEKQYANSREMINNDIDRLNNFLAIGIGFLGLLGVFIPLIMNFLTVGDIKETVRNLDDKLNKLVDETIPTTKKNANAALDVSKEAKDKAEKALDKSKRIEELETRIINSESTISKVEDTVNKSIPKVETLVIQNAIGRFFNMSPYILSTTMGTSEKEHLVDIMNTISVGFKNCQDFNKSPKDDVFLKATIIDFKVALSRRYITSSFGKKGLYEFEKLAKYLGILENEETEEKILAAYSGIVKALENIISEIKSSVN